MALKELHVIPVDAEELTVYRVVATDDRESAAFIDSFKSSDALGLPPRQGSPEERFCLIHNGVSCFLTPGRAAKVAKRWRIGSFIAEVRLRPGQGICVAEWGSRGHVTVWADPVKLSDMTVDIVAVGQEP